MSALNQRVWNPYVAGILIGLLQIPAFLLVDTALGASSSFVTAAGWALSIVDPSVTEIKYFAKYMSKDKYYWQSALVIGIALGAFFSARFSGAKRPTFANAWTRMTGIKSLAGRMMMGFVGGFVLLLGARIAGGCTSGHGISGMAQLALGSIAAVCTMFIGGILVAMMFRKV